MGVAIDKSGQHDPTSEIDRPRRLRPLAARRYGGDAFLGHSDVDQRKAVAVERPGQMGRTGTMHPRVAEHIPA